MLIAHFHLASVSINFDFSVCVFFSLLIVCAFWIMMLTIKILQNKSQITSDCELIFTIKSTISLGIKTFLMSFHCHLLSFIVIYMHTTHISHRIALASASASTPQWSAIADPLDIKCAEVFVWLTSSVIFNLISPNVRRPSVPWTSSLASKPRRV